MRKVICLSLLIVLGPATPALGWNNTGHRLVALVAWEQLPQTSRDKVVQTLRSHPRFSEDFVLPPDVAGAEGVTQDRWRFAHAATWPDQARGLKGAERKAYHHGSWHWINVPFFLRDVDREELEADLPTNLATTWDPTAEGRLNVVQAIARTRHVLQQKDASSSERALALCWLFHTVGDIHQPLHSTALFTSRRFRTGDAGGNGIMVEGAEDLHAVWDDLLADVATLSQHDSLVTQVTADERVLREAKVGARTLDTVDWLDESHDLARNVTYNDAILDVVAANEAIFDPSKSYREQPYLLEVKLSDHYLARARRIAIQRIVLAGHRLAAILREAGF